MLKIIIKFTDKPHLTLLAVCFMDVGELCFFYVLTKYEYVIIVLSNLTPITDKSTY